MTIGRMIAEKTFIVKMLWGVSEFTGWQMDQVLYTCIKCYVVSVPVYSVYL